MILDEGLLIKSRKFIQNNKWYHQRFDGCPQFILIISEAELKKEARKFSWGHGLTHWGIFKNDNCDWYIDMRDIRRITNQFINHTKTDSRFSKKIIRKWEGDENRFYRYCHLIGKINFSELSNNDLKKIYQEMLKRSIEAVSSSSIIDGFALGSDNYIFEKLNKLLTSRGLKRQKQRYFSILTAPVHLSFITEAEIKLLRIGLQIKKNESLYNYIMRSKLNHIQKQIKSYKKIYNALSEYQKKYFWVRNNYVDNNVLSINFFLKELVVILKGRVDIENEIKRLVNTSEKSQVNKQKLIKELKIPANLRNLLIVSEDFTYWQDERKKITYWYNHYLSLILEEIAKRFSYTIHQLKYLYYSELLDLFEKERKYLIKKSEINIRFKSCLWYQKGIYFDQISGRKADQLSKELLRIDRKQRIDDFRGMSAYKGVARGPVRIVKSIKECNRVKKGDVIVAVMTRPDYVQAMKKAVAVVTNEGGVTCHAAIISRELGIPCIIGTKIGTEVLKDGMEVEVNANHGVVKIIK